MKILMMMLNQKGHLLVNIINDIIIIIIMQLH
jgi:hypothetical protein